MPHDRQKFKLMALIEAALFVGNIDIIKAIGESNPNISLKLIIAGKYLAMCRFVHLNCPLSNDKVQMAVIFFN